MDCFEIRKLLDRYIDNDLSKDAFVIVRKHVSSCKECGAELALLKKYKKEMASFKAVTAPSDFLQQLNRRIDKQSGFIKILRSLFIPLKIKLPIEAFGVLATVVIIVLLVNPADQIKKNIQIADSATSEENASEVRQEAEIADIRISAKKAGKAELSLPEERGDDRMLAKAEKKSVSVRGEAVKTREIVLALFQVNPEVASGSFKSMAPATRALQSEESAGVNAMDMKKDKASGAGMETDRISDSAKSEKIDGTEKETQATEMSTAQKLNAQKAQDESINRQVTIAQPIEDIKKITLSLNGRVIKEVSGAANQARYIIVEIQAGSQKEFLDRLSMLGSMRSKEKKPLDTGKFNKLRFKINIKQME